MNFKLRHIAILAIFIVYACDWHEAQPVALLIYALLIISDDFKDFKLNQLDISTAYAALLILTSISHMIAMYGWSDSRWFFVNVYTGELAGKAVFIFNVGSVCLMEAMRSRIRPNNDEENQASAIKNLSFTKVFIIAILVFLLSITARAQIFALGSFGSFILTLVNGSVFLLAFIARKKGQGMLLVLIFTIFLCLRALQFSYLRMEIVLPLIAYFMGDLLASQSLLRIHTYSKAAIVVSLIIFPPLFTFLGENRSKLSGSERLDNAIQVIGSGEEAMKGSREGDVKDQTIMSRLSVIPQISKIILLTEKKGFYNGQTLEYLGYVFIPRVIWPDKPLIKQGQWFALEIGAAYKAKNGKVNNSVNMTVPGEFYLNFGYVGLFIGCILFGSFMGWLWNQTNYLTLFGWGFRFYLLFLGLFSLGSDLQIVPTLIAYLLVYKMMNYFKIGYSKDAVLYQPGLNRL